MRAMRPGDPGHDDLRNRVDELKAKRQASKKPSQRLRDIQGNLQKKERQLSDKQTLRDRMVHEIEQRQQQLEE